MTHPFPINARLHIDSDAPLHRVDSRLFGSFVEHLGRCVYTGIFEEDHPTADAAGFRQDVAEMIRELGSTLLRYPGGNFVSTYQWEDGVGPVEDRPTRLDFAWRTTEPNTVGTTEFIRWCHGVDCEPMFAFNLGTRGVTKALQYWEYCSHPGGTTPSDLRISHGYTAPHNVRIWCLGNEMGGPWQMGYKAADEYGRLACETARALKQCDPTLELIVAGSYSPELPTFPEWDRAVLEHTYEFVDYISLHIYVNDEKLTALAEYLAVELRMGSQIRTIAAVCDYVKALKRGKKDIYLTYDEWNVWHWKNMHPPEFQPWCQAPAQVKQTCNMAEAVVFGSLIITLLRQSNRVRNANLTQLVNVIAPIMTTTVGGVWKQVIFYPFTDASKLGRGEVVRTRLVSPTYPTAEFGEVNFIDAVALRKGGAMTVFAINQLPTEALPSRLNCPSSSTSRSAISTRLPPTLPTKWTAFHPAPQPSPARPHRCRGMCCACLPTSDIAANNLSPIPTDFLWSVATASYQIEGARDADGKGPSIWDMMCRKEGAIPGGATGDVACDHYHRMKTDVPMMKEMGRTAYRFSISWARALPEGVGSVNQAGLDFYSTLVDELIPADIEPCAMLYHWELPLSLHHRGGWMNREFASWFAEHATLVGRALGDRVKWWMTLNEPSAFIIAGYLEQHRVTEGRGFISIPTGSHDFQRPRRGRKLDDLKVLHAMLFTMPEVPFLYYGDEIGMRNVKGLAEKEGSMWRTGNRTPMQWEAGSRNLGFSSAPPEQLYLPVDPAEDAPTVSAQLADNYSLLHFTRKLINLRRKYSALGNDGTFRNLYAEAGQYSFLYERAESGGRFAIAINPSESSHSLDLPCLKRSKIILGKGAKINDSRLLMDGVSFIILRLSSDF